MAKLRAVLLRRWPILAVTTLVGVLAGFVSASVGSERGITFYQAQQVIVANRQPGNVANVNQDALKVTRGKVLQRAAELLDEEQPERLVGAVRAKVETESNSITLSAVDPDPQQASRVVQAFAAAFLEVVNSELRSEDVRLLEQLTAKRDEAKAALEAFDAENGFVARGDLQLPQTPTLDALIAERNRLIQLYNSAQQQLDEFELRTRQTEPYSSLGPEKPKVADAQLIEVPDSPLFRAGLLGLIGLLLGVGLVLIIERVNQRIDTRSELAELLQVPILAEIGRIPARHRHAKGEETVSLDGVWSEHYRRVRSAIQFVQADATARADTGSGLGVAPVAGPQAAVISSHRAQTGAVPRIFLVVSALPGDGKSTTAALTALALAETGQDTVVVDADFRKPKVEKYLGVAKSPSLADRAVLSLDRPSIDEIVQPGPVPHLWVAASGPPTAEVTARIQAAKEVAAEAATRGGTVIIDTSPLRVSNDPIDLLAAVDEVILVVRAGRTTVRSIEDTMDLLAVHHAPVLGVVLIGTLSTREMYAYYQSYYRYSGETAHGEGSGGSGDGNGSQPQGPPPPPTVTPPPAPSFDVPPARNGSSEPKVSEPVARTDDGPRFAPGG